MVVLMNLKILIFGLFIFHLGCAHSNRIERAPQNNELVTVHQEYDVLHLNKDIKHGLPTFDLVIFHSKQADVSWESLLEGIVFAKEVFKKNGIQMNVLRAQSVDFPTEWHYLVEKEFLGKPVEDPSKNEFYENFNLERALLSKKAIQVFSSLLENYRL